MRFAGLFLVAGLMLSASSGAAQTGAPVAAAPHLDPTESSVVQEVEVIGRPPGPPLWKVARGDSQVIILGAVTPVAHLLQWNTIRVEHALDGADALLMPPRGRAGIIDSVGLLLTFGQLRLPRDRTLKSMLPPADWAHLQAISVQIHQDPNRYARWKPALAGVTVLGDFLKAAGLSGAKPGTTVIKLAEARRVPVHYAGDLRVVPLVKGLAKLSDAGHVACFEAVLAAIDQLSVHARPAGEAWAAGDLKGVRTHYAFSSAESCLQGAPSLRDAVEQGTAASVRAIDEALKRPGKTVAVVDLNFLLRPDGVLDRLKAQSSTVTVPRE